MILQFLGDNTVDTDARHEAQADWLVLFPSSRTDLTDRVGITPNC